MDKNKNLNVKDIFLIFIIVLICVVVKIYLPTLIKNREEMILGIRVFSVIKGVSPTVLLIAPIYIIRKFGTVILSEIIFILIMYILSEMRSGYGNITTPISVITISGIRLLVLEIIFNKLTDDKYVVKIFLALVWRIIALIFSIINIVIRFNYNMDNFLTIEYLKNIAYQEIIMFIFSIILCKFVIDSLAVLGLFKNYEIEKYVNKEEEEDFITREYKSYK